MRSRKAPSCNASAARRTWTPSNRFARAFTASTCATWWTLSQNDSMREIVMEDFAFVLPRPVALRLGTPTALILRNRDIVRHGFTSPALPQLTMSVDGEGVVAYGKGIEGVYVDPGKTLVLYLTPERGGSYSFRCDLHQHMKGELLTLDLPAA